MLPGRCSSALTLGESIPRLVSGSAITGDVVVRGVAGPDYQSAFLTIDPISEAAVEILSGPAYGPEQLVALTELIRTANAATSFAGLSLRGAIGKARAVATADPPGYGRPYRPGPPP